MAIDQLQRLEEILVTQDLSSTIRVESINNNLDDMQKSLDNLLDKDYLTYDVILKTSEDLQSLINSGWKTAEGEVVRSVLIAGDIESTSWITLPDNLATVHAISGVSITLNVTESGSFGYADTENVRTGSFKNIHLIINASNLADNATIQGFSHLGNLNNCSVDIQAEGDSIFAIGFISCEQMINCSASISSGKAIGFQDCSLLAGCKADCNGSVSHVCYASCRYCSNCSSNTATNITDLWDDTSYKMNLITDDSDDKNLLYIVGEAQFLTALEHSFYGARSIVINDLGQPINIKQAIVLPDQVESFVGLGLVHFNISLSGEESIAIQGKAQLKNVSITVVAVDTLSSATNLSITVFKAFNNISHCYGSISLQDISANITTSDIRCYSECTRINDCTAEVSISLAGAARIQHIVAGFRDCSYMEQCSANISTPGSSYGYYNCKNLMHCTGEYSVSTLAGAVFLLCSNLICCDTTYTEEGNTVFGDYCKNIYNIWGILGKEIS